MKIVAWLLITISLLITGCSSNPLSRDSMSLLTEDPVSQIMPMKSVTSSTDSRIEFDSLDQLMSASDVVIIGKVKSVVTEFDLNWSTYSVIEVMAVASGGVQVGDELSIIEIGGIVSNRDRYTALEKLDGYPEGYYTSQHTEEELNTKSESTLNGAHIFQPNQVRILFLNKVAGEYYEALVKYKRLGAAIVTDANDTVKWPTMTRATLNQLF